MIENENTNEDWKSLDRIASTVSVDNKPIFILSVHITQGIPYALVSFDNQEPRNLILHSTMYADAADCPYNQLPNLVPYLVIENNVYALDNFKSLDQMGLDYVDEDEWVVL